MATGTQLIINGTNRGRDATITITDSLGATVQGPEIGAIKEINIKPKYDQRVTKTIVQGGRVFHDAMPAGYTIDLKLARYKGTLENMFTSYDNNTYNGLFYFFIIQVQVKNPDGSVNTYLHPHCVPNNGDAGHYVHGNDVDQMISFESDQMVDNSNGGGGPFSVQGS